MSKSIPRFIKLLATSRKVDGSYCAMVAPRLLSPEHPLYSVNDVFNAVFVHGNVLGDAMFYGSGAGKLPTASAVVADIVDMAKHLGKNIPIVWSSNKLELADYKNASSAFFVRARKDETEVKTVFGDVSFVKAEGVTGETGFVTKEMPEKEYEEKAEKLGGIVQMIRVV